MGETILEPVDIAFREHMDGSHDHHRDYCNAMCFEAGWAAAHEVIKSSLDEIETDMQTLRERLDARDALGRNGQ